MADAAGEELDLGQQFGQGAPAGDHGQRQGPGRGNDADAFGGPPGDHDALPAGATDSLTAVLDRLQEAAAAHDQN